MNLTFKKTLVLVYVAISFFGFYYNMWSINKVKEVNKIQDSLFNDMYYAVIDTNEKDAFLVTLTTYNASKLQTDDTPNLTSYQFKIDPKNPFSQRFIGLSRDLLEEFRYGEIVIVENAGIYNGYYIVADCMNNRFIRCVDILIGNKQKHTKLKNIVLKHANKDD
jgi:3D (Asp-Asp-Asp) domain-containing protein